MKAPLLYRIAAILLVLFAVGHTLGFRRVDPRWGVDSVIATLRSSYFKMNGFNRTYWDFFAGFGFFVTVLLLFAALAAWQIAALPRESLSAIPLITWGLAACFGIVTFVGDTSSWSDGVFLRNHSVLYSRGLDCGKIISRLWDDRLWKSIAAQEARYCYREMA